MIHRKAPEIGGEGLYGLFVVNIIEVFVWKRLCHKFQRILHHFVQFIVGLKVKIHALGIVCLWKFDDELFSICVGIFELNRESLDELYNTLTT